MTGLSESGLFEYHPLSMACPFLAHPAKSDIRPTSPTPGNSCYAGRSGIVEVVALSTETQRSLCLKDRFESCQWLKAGLSSGVAYPTWVTAPRQQRGNGRRAWWQFWGS